MTRQKTIKERKLKNSINFGHGHKPSKKNILENYGAKSDTNSFKKDLNLYHQFFYIEEILLNILFDFRYNRVNKLGKMFLYKYDLDLVGIEVID